jgi:hypothetical protein
MQALLEGLILATLAQIMEGFTLLQEALMSVRTLTIL